MALTDTALKALEAAERPYKRFDEHGLYIEIYPTGGKLWRFKYRFAGKEKRLSLGPYPKISLPEAREKRDRFRALLSDGADPSFQARQQRADLRADELGQPAGIRFSLDNDGALTFHLGARRLALKPAETAELRAFLDATRAVSPKE